MNIDNQHGKVLSIVLVFSILAQLLGGYLLTQAVNNRNLLHYEQIRIDSNYLTEAAFQFILSKLADDKNLSGNFVYSIEQIIPDGISADNVQGIEDGNVNMEIYPFIDQLEEADKELNDELNEELYEELADELNEELEETEEQLDYQYVKISIINNIKYRMLDFDVEHSVYAIVNVETLAIIKRDWYDFTLKKYKLE
jgi:hypothetical protein